MASAPANASPAVLDAVYTRADLTTLVKMSGMSQNGTNTSPAVTRSTSPVTGGKQSWSSPAPGSQAGSCVWATAPRPPSPGQSCVWSAAPQQAAVPAAAYVADASDPIDKLLAWHLKSLDGEASSKLMLRRISPGRYEVDGRCVGLRWHSGDSAKVVVREDGMSDDTALAAYLRQAANVAMSLSASQRRPRHDTDTPGFGCEVEASTEWPDRSAQERLRSMHVAVEQARVAEQSQAVPIVQVPNMMSRLQSAPARPCF